MSEVENEGLEVGGVRAIVTDAFVSMIEAALGMKAPDCAPPAFIQSAIDRAIDRINSEALAGYAVRDAQIAELEAKYQRDVYGLNNEGDSIGGEPAGGYANDNSRLRAELSALKAQDTVGEVVGWYRLDRPYEMTSYPSVCAAWHKLGAPVVPLYAAPVAKQVVMPARMEVPGPLWSDTRQPYGSPLNLVDIAEAKMFNMALDEVTRLNAADHAEGGI